MPPITLAADRDPMLPRLDIASTALVAGLAHLLLALTVWSLLWRRHPARQLLPWSLGSMAIGVALTLFAARGQVPGWATYELANSLLYASLVLRVLALRRDLGRPGRAAVAAAVWVLASLGYAVCASVDQLGPRVLYSTVLTLAGTLILAHCATQLGRLTRSSAAYLLASVEWLLCLALAVRLVTLASGGSPWQGEVSSWDNILLFLGFVTAALYGNLGYMGMVLDRARQAQQTHQEQRLAEAAGRQAAENKAADLHALLAERDRLAVERSHLLEVLAHEIRQPVHNANGALHAAFTALQASPARDSPQIATPLHQARDMLGGLQAVLDNALAATVLLSRDQPLLLREVELDFVTALALGDLAPAHRERVQQVRETTLRSAELEPHLVRLALRNLLQNAFRHGGDAVTAQLRVSETAQPPRLLLSVVDDGAALSDCAWQRLSQAASAPALPPGRQGLGLYITARVMALHGGELRLAARAPHGLVATLAFPLPEDDARPLPGQPG